MRPLPHRRRCVWPKAEMKRFLLLKRVLLLLLFSGLAVAGWGQQAWCRSYADFAASRWDTLPAPVSLRPERGNALALDVRAPRRLRRLLSRQAFALRVGGETYLNLRPMPWWGAVFVRLYVLSDGTLLFARPDVTNSGGFVAAYGSTQRPVSGRALRNPSRLENLVCYRFVPTGRAAEMGIDKIDERWLRLRLQHRPDLLSDYAALRPARRDAADVVLHFLWRAEQAAPSTGAAAPSP